MTSAPSSVGASGGRTESGKQIPCDTWPRSLIVLIRKPEGSVTLPVGSVGAGLKLLMRRNSNSGRSGRSESISQYTSLSPG